jgi:hypothetical protein
VHGIEVYFVGVGSKGSVLERFPNIKKKKKKKKEKEKKSSHMSHANFSIGFSTLN